MDIILLSPVGGKPLVFKRPWRSSEEIVKTIYWACDDFPELKPLLDDEGMAGSGSENLENIRRLCDSFNVAVQCLAPSIRITSPRPSNAHLKHILRQVYDRAVVDPQKLNRYQPFSPEVYGETYFELVNQMIQVVRTSKADIFLDLGCGVGQVVLQMTASTSCSLCFGIEKNERPFQYAKAMNKYFKAIMGWYGKSYGSYRFLLGNFFDNEFRPLISSSTIIFVNNLAFGPSVDHKLKMIFAELPDGARIFSSKAYCPLNFRITDRNLSDIGAIMTVIKLEPIPSSVSWTAKPTSYYLQTIDRTKLELYFENKKNNAEAASRYKRSTRKREERGDDEWKMELRSRSRSARCKSEPPTSGVTTRKAWSDYCKSVARISEANDSDNNNNNNNNVQNKSSCSNESKRRPCPFESSSDSNSKERPPVKPRSRSTTVEKRSTKTPRRKQLFAPRTRSGRSSYLTQAQTASTQTPPAPLLKQEIPDDLTNLLNSYCDSYMAMLEHMKSEEFRSQVNQRITTEKKMNAVLKAKCAQLNILLSNLQQLGVSHIQSRMSELRMSGLTIADLVTGAGIMTFQHLHLQQAKKKIEAQIQILENNIAELVQSSSLEEIIQGAEREKITVPEFFYQKIEMTQRKYISFASQVETLNCAIGEALRELDAAI